MTGEQKLGEGLAELPRWPPHQGEAVIRSVSELDIRRYASSTQPYGVAP